MKYIFSIRSSEDRHHAILFLVNWYTSNGKLVDAIMNWKFDCCVEVNTEKKTIYCAQEKPSTNRPFLSSIWVWVVCANWDNLDYRWMFKWAEYYWEDSDITFDDKDLFKTID